jgi:DNA-binding response OmpR family regulator
LKSGASDFLTKPVNSGKLVSKIDELLRAPAANPTARRCRCILDFGGLTGFSLGESLLKSVME